MMSLRSRKALFVLAKLHARHDLTQWFFTRSIGGLNAAALRKIEKDGLVNIDRQAANSFRYGLSDAGKAWIEKQQA